MGRGIRTIRTTTRTDTGAQDWAWASDISTTIRSATAVTGTAADTATAVTATEVRYGGGDYQPVRNWWRLRSTDPIDGGSLRLKLKPREAQVFIDGYFVGVVDSYDGAFQKLSVEKGGHRVELKADGYEPLSFDVLITPGETVTYKGEMKRIQ